MKCKCGNEITIEKAWKDDNWYALCKCDKCGRRGYWNEDRELIEEDKVKNLMMYWIGYYVALWEKKLSQRQRRKFLGIFGGSSLMNFYKYKEMIDEMIENMEVHFKNNAIDEMMRYDIKNKIFGIRD